jgi:hypothetical protein
MSLDENIRHDAKHLRLSLRISAIDHTDKAKQCNALVAAINDFLGEAKPESTKSSKVEYSSAADAVRSVIFAFGDRPFSLNDVERAMTTLKSNVLADKPAIRVTLWKMANQGELEIVERGTGRRPTTYRAKNLKIVRYRRTSK